jgi:hypothetical protein
MAQKRESAKPSQVNDWATLNSALPWWISACNMRQFGLMLQIVGTPPSQYNNGFAQGVAHGPNARDYPCRRVPRP